MFATRCLTLSCGRILRNQFTRNLTSSEVAPNAGKDEIVEKTEEKTIVVSQDGAIRLIGINRPAKKNCLDAATAQLLSEALDDFEQDENSTVGILHGIGGSFSSGFDLDEIAKSNVDSEEGFPHFGPLSNRDSLVKKPLIGSISGYAVGAGFELALMCDLRIVEETASMGFLNRRMGIPIMSGGTVRLPAIIGYSRAMDMILSGKLINADQAYQWGLTNLVVACGSALGQCIVTAHTLMKYPQKALLADRMSAHYAAFSSKQIDEALQFEKDNSSHILLEEGVEGAQRFISEKAKEKS
ncbi:probable enoyl-CoA hydratase echA8 isoform X2 [Venturia canescens]|uniref:probable enoyl-CoA hydratase echA8 isoform X2 n=1 Tax=Venturia canescens TaxID=32260 RepID=UPI001C9C0AF4|nr:probable enoyl-CoA hydratase echA8 isoform X2 [Venturia canescens]